MKKIFAFIWFAGLFLLLQQASAQGPQKGKFAGACVQLAFGDTGFVKLSPYIGYRFNHFFAAGFGVHGQYECVKDYDQYTGDLFTRQKSTVLGLNLFGRFYPIRNLMIQVQPEANYTFGKITFYDTNPKETYNLDAEIVPSILVGGGLVLPTNKGEWIAAAFYDVLQFKDTPYGRRAIMHLGYDFRF